MRPLILFALLVPLSLPATGQTVSALWGRDGENWSATSRLPDFSFAGYRRGEAPIPSPAVTHNIRDFGAKGDGTTDDTAAFRRAVAEVPAGVILIPAGRYVISDIIEITKPNVVLRGEGRDRTVLYFPRTLTDVRPDWGATTEGRRTSNYSWSGGFLWVKGSLGLGKITEITAPAVRGDTRLTVASTAGLAVGATIAVRQHDTDENTLAHHLYSGEPGNVANLRGRSFTSLPARIVAIGRHTITLDRPLRTDLRPEWSPAIHRHAPTVAEVGIEDLGFEFPNTPYGGHFTELGYNPVAFSGVAHCWIRRIRIRNCDSGPFIAGDFCTVEDVLYETERAPDQRRQGRGHHGVTLSGNDNLFTRFDIRMQFEHDITLGACAAGNVVSRGRGEDLCFDHHRRAPYENLFTDIDVGAGTHVWRCGGGAALGLHCGARGTFWNIRSRQPLAYPRAGFGPASMNLVGLTTDAPNLTEPDGKWFEAIPPDILHPQDLHEAQRARRLR